ncbi:MAG: hypothetical protein JWQ49_5402 [Edaphobacter sp.]|nr:hypothetical protein [Edaphobacter sp.]
MLAGQAVVEAVECVWSWVRGDHFETMCQEQCGPAGTDDSGSNDCDTTDGFVSRHGCFSFFSEQISAMTSKDAPRGKVKSVAGPGLMETYNLVTIRRGHLPRHEVIPSKAEARKILHIPSSR